MTSPSNTGFLWYEPDREKTLETILREAVDFCHAKHAFELRACHLNPVHFSPPATAHEKSTLAGLKLVSDPGILPRDFWLIP